MDAKRKDNLAAINARLEDVLLSIEDGHPAARIFAVMLGDYGREEQLLLAEQIIAAAKGRARHN
jgi:hypothetical protein